MGWETTCSNNFPLVLWLFHPGTVQVGDIPYVPGIFSHFQTQETLYSTRHWPLSVSWSWAQSRVPNFLRANLRSSYQETGDSPLPFNEDLTSIYIEQIATAGPDLELYIPISNLIYVNELHKMKGMAAWSKTPSPIKLTVHFNLSQGSGLQQNSRARMPASHSPFLLGLQTCVCS